jgi:hypothetical protein
MKTSSIINPIRYVFWSPLINLLAFYIDFNDLQQGVLSMKFAKFLTILFLVLIVVPTFAQEHSLFPLAAIKNHNVWLVGFRDEPKQISDGKASDYSNLVWSPKGNYLAFHALDENFSADVWIYNRSDASLKQIESDVIANFPASFSEDEKQLIFLKDNTPPGSGSKDLIDVYSYEVSVNAAGMKIATVDIGEGCGGGSSFPADWRYWDETGGLGGFYSVLELTPFGLIYSKECGYNTVLLNLESGEEVLFDHLSRVAVSADRTKAAGITYQPGNRTHETLMIVDLKTHEITPVETTALPDQVVWGASGSSELFYSTRQMTDRIIPTSSEAIERINAVLGTSGQVNFWEVTIHQVDIERAADVERYRADAYAVGRMSTTSGEESLVFSQVSNAEALLEEIAAGRLDQSDPDKFAASAELVPVQTFSLSLNDGLSQLLSTDLYEATVLPKI